MFDVTEMRDRTESPVRDTNALADEEEEEDTPSIPEDHFYDIGKLKSSGTSGHWRLLLTLLSFAEKYVNKPQVTADSGIPENLLMLQYPLFLVSYQIFVLVWIRGYL